MKCPNCQSENRDGAKYCDECGFPLSGRIAAVAAAAVAENEEGGALEALAETSAGDIEEAAETLSSKGEIAEIPETAFDDASEDVASGDVDDSVSFEGPFAANDEGSSDFSAEEDTLREGLGDIPAIEVAGVNVDENGEAFDFSYGPEEDFAEDGNLFEQQATRAIPPVETEEQGDSTLDDGFFEAGKTADLSGIERLVDPGYAPPASAWRAGDTMEMPAIAQASSGSKRDFRATDANEKKPGGKRKGIVAAIIVVLLACAVAAAATYYVGLWGGRVVPDVVGKSQADAIYELEGAGFSVKLMEVKSDDVEGKVLLTDPAAGSRQEQGSEVVVHVSVARVVPNVVGLPRDEAAGLFKNEGLDDVTYETEYSDEAKGSVLSVSPEAGQKVKGSTHIVVTLATPYVVPDVAGKTQDEAVAALVDAGFTANVVQVYSEDAQEGTAIGTDPAAGTELASGSTVTVSVAKSRANELTSATHTYFQSSSMFLIDGVTYEVDSSTLDVTYAGDGVTKYSVSARVVETHDYLFFGSQTLYGDWKTISGSLTWSDDNGIAASSPQIARA